MRFTILTPVASASAIGRVTTLVGAELVALGHEIIYVATELVPPPTEVRHEALRDAISWHDTADVWETVETADLVLHQFGNHYGNHAGIVEWLPKLGGALVLHDIYAAHFFHAFCAAAPRSASHVLETTYGMTLEEFLGLTTLNKLDERLWPHTTMTEWLVPNADTVIVHSGFGRSMVHGLPAIAVETLPLPYVSATLAPTTKSEGRLRLLTVGGVNPNKLVDEIVLTIASDRRLRSSVEYHVVGGIVDRERRYLEGLAADLGVDLQIHGQASDGELAAELAKADLVACLRTPTYEAASASAIEAMLAGKAALVLDHGFYASLPKDAVISIPPEDRRAALRRALLDGVSGAIDLAAVGGRARTYAEATFRADTYAQKLVELAHQPTKRISRTLLTSYAELAEWDPDAPGSPGAIFRDDMEVFRP